MARIVNINGLPDPNRILAGQSLVTPTEDAFYTVRAGDTLWKISQTYGTTVQANVLDYALTVIPANKIFFGFQLYGLKMPAAPRPNSILSGLTN